MGLIIEATKCINAFPANSSRNLYSAHPTFHKIVDKHSEKMLSIISKIIKLQNIKGNIQRFPSICYNLQHTCRTYQNLFYSYIDVTTMKNLSCYLNAMT